jgi:tetratricopeptide (TPR) repeat protein
VDDDKPGARPTPAEDQVAKDAKRHRARELLERGYQLQLEGAVEDAEACYRRSLAVAPSAEAHTYLGWALAHAGRIDEAIEECHAALRLDPKFGNAWQDLGAYHMEKGEDSRAAGYLRRALDMPRFERHHYAHVNLGRVFLKQGLVMKALDEFKVAVTLEPRDVYAKKSIREIMRNFN